MAMHLSGSTLSLLSFVLQDDDPILRVRQFQVTNWPPNAAFPNDEGTLLDVMDMVTRWQQQSGVTPVVVHCM